MESDQGLKEVNPIEKAEKEFFKIVEEEKSKKQKKMVGYFSYCSICLYQVLKRFYFEQENKEDSQ